MILTSPNPLLFQKCEEVTAFTPELKVILDSMYEQMKKSRGIGLAANQIGVLRRMFVMDDMDGSPLYLVNPEIVSCSIYLSVTKEGCLSFPGEFVNIKRPVWVKVSFQDENGQKKSLGCVGLWAKIIQHEMEHLDGNHFLQHDSIPRAEKRILNKRWLKK